MSLYTITNIEKYSSFVVRFFDFSSLKVKFIIIFYSNFDSC